MKKKLHLSNRIFLLNKPFVDLVNIKQYYHIKQEPDNSIIIPLSKNNKFLLVYQKRMPINRRIYEFPCGYVDKGETAIKAAKRELYEETGYYAISKPIKISCFYADPGRNTRKVHLFYSENIKKKGLPEKNIEISFFTKSEVIKLIKDEKFSSSQNIAAFFQFLYFYNKI